MLNSIFLLIFPKIFESSNSSNTLKFTKFKLSYFVIVIFSLHLSSLFSLYIFSRLFISDIYGYFGFSVFITYKIESSLSFFLFRNSVFLTTNYEYLSLKKLLKCSFIRYLFFYGIPSFIVFTIFFLHFSTFMSDCLSVLLGDIASVPDLLCLGLWLFDGNDVVWAVPSLINVFSTWSKGFYFVIDFNKIFKIYSFWGVLYFPYMFFLRMSII